MESKFVFPDLHYKIIFKICTKMWRFSKENPKYDLNMGHI